MAEKSPFDTEWRRCLREHYKYVVRENDTITEKSLTQVLHRVGFDDAELSQLYLQATLRQDDLAQDFTPDTTKIIQAHPAECTCAACSPEDIAVQEAMLEAGHDEDGQPLPVTEEPETPEPEAAGNLFAGVALSEQAESDDADTETNGLEPSADENIADEPDAEDDTDEPRQMTMF